MKKRIKLFLLVAVLSALGLLFKSFSLGPSYSRYTPVFMQRAELEKSVFFEEKGRPMVNPGKIYYKEPYIYVNERYKGVHMIDNSDPANPKNVAFIVAPGVGDIAIKGTTLYLDNSVDLVAFDLLNKKEVKRLKNVFPEPMRPDGMFDSWGISRPSEDFIIVEWKKR